MSEKIMTFRVDEDLKKAFEKIAERADLTSSQMLRHFMRDVVDDYMKKNAQGSLLEQKKRGK